ncbi:MAG: hypothetical protein J7623_22805 [Chitinophaga sp.]|uniref:hypothetical protein n=1 Tax=Chitinophaga sp. TaxID=1869181 RepID=UPI001B0E6A27|nr:hypothetical protein [Chitinophaga sp.]MBO9731489.1 hypothetical protein [Chitinophaga sp.]
MELTDEKLSEALKKFIAQGNCFTTVVRDILTDYKNSGGLKETAQQILMQLKNDYPHNEAVHDCIDDILDMITGWCQPGMRVW